MKEEIWIARDLFGGVYLYDGKPVRNEETLCFEGGKRTKIIGRIWSFVVTSDITWENSPQRLFSFGCIENLTISNRSGTAQHLLNVLNEVKDTLWRTKNKDSREDMTPLLSWCMCMFVWNIKFKLETNRACKKEARKYLLDQFNKWWDDIVRFNPDKEE